MVRLSAGRWKGRALEIPAGARPTSSRAREALFDIVGPRIAGSGVLDLHAGSGAVGLEAISRGAARAVLVDVETGVLRRNLERLDGAASVEVIDSDAGDAVGRLVERGDRFEVVFSDPPYARVSTASAARLADLLAPGGLLVVQADAGTRVEAPNGLRAVRERAYGRNVFHFFEQDVSERKVFE
jgi:16S rRNA (guanine(966)-N(2))-methyltransferase RsmD